MSASVSGSTARLLRIGFERVDRFGHGSTARTVRSLAPRSRGRQSLAEQGCANRLVGVDIADEIALGCALGPARGIVAVSARDVDARVQPCLHIILSKRDAILCVSCLVFYRPTDREGSTSDPDRERVLAPADAVAEVAALVRMLAIKLRERVHGINEMVHDYALGIRQTVVAGDGVVHAAVLV